MAFWLRKDQFSKVKAVGFANRRDLSYRRDRRAERRRLRPDCGPFGKLARISALARAVSLAL
jgi:hypothetical protein